MNIARLEPTLRMLLTADAEELRQEAELGRIALQLVEGIPRVTVLVTHNGLPELDDVEVLSNRGDIATLRMDLERLDALSERPEVVYINAARSGKPVLHRTRAQVGASIVDGRTIRLPAEPWDGTGTTVGVVDSGFDVRHPSLRRYPGGPTRVHLYWDRSIAVADRRPGDQAGPNNIGVLYDRARIDAHLLGPAANPQVLHPNSIGMDQHGTHVAGIAAGSAAPYRGIATGANLILVRTGTGDLGQLADICEWIFVNAIGPCSINISLGNNSGPHDGTSVAERALDDLLRSPSTLTPFQGRLITVAAGNEARKGWHVRARVLGTDGPVTPILWESPGGNEGRDEIVFACSGHDRIRLRVRAPGGVRTNFVTPDPANGSQSIDEAVPGGLAPTVAGSQGEKVFNFADGTSVRIAHVEDPINGDRQMEVHFRPPAAAGGAITDGVWQIEFQGATNDLPGGGILHGYLRDDVPNIHMDSSFVRPAVASRTLRVSPGTMLEQELFVSTSATAEAIVILDYPGDRELEFQLRPPLHLLAAGSNPSQWVRHGDPDPVAVADAALTAPGAANADHRLPFAFGAQQAEIGHGTVGSRRRITLQLPGAGPTAGLYRLRLRTLSGDRPVEVEARLQQDASGRFELSVFRDDPNEVVELGVFPAATIESALRLRANGVPERVGVRVTVPGGGLVDARVRFAPLDGGLATAGHRFTPWVGPGNAETAAAGSIPVAGGAAGPRTYNDDADARVEIAYPAPAVGADGEMDLTFSNPSAPAATVRGGEWRIELRGRDDSSHRVRCELRHVSDQVDDFGLAQISPIEQDQVEVDLLRTPFGASAIPFTIDRDIGDEVRLELLYDAASSARVRLLPPDPERLRFAVESGNRVVTDPGAPAPAAGAAGVTATLTGGAVIVIDHPQAPVFPGVRRVLITIRSPAGRVVFPPRGVWRIEAELVTIGGSPIATARLATAGRPATFLTYTPANDDFQQGSLSVPGCAREILSVANCHPSPSSITLPANSTSAGPVRSATRMRLGGASRQWQPYTKPEVTAPGTDVASAFSSFAPLWLDFDSPNEWVTITLPDGRDLPMREGWPLLEGDQPRVVHPVPSAPAAGTLTQTVWEVEFPDLAFRSTLRVRYPVGNPFAVRIEQPAAVPAVPAPAAPTRTHAVGPNGAEINVALPGVTPAGTPAPPHPDGPGRSYTMGDDGHITIRQNGAGLATVEFSGTIHPGRWRLIVQHDQVLPAPVPVAVETEPSADALGWPKFFGQNPRRTQSIGQAASAAAPGEVNFRLNIPLGFMPTVTVDITYPPPPAGPGAYSFELLVVSPAGHTHAVDTNSVVLPVQGGTAPAPPAVPNGAQFDIAHGPSGANHVVITHTPGRARVVISRGTSTAFAWADGDWDIRFLNRSQANPAAPVSITADVEIGPHDAPFFRIPDGFLPLAFTRFGHLAAGTAQGWSFRVPPRRRLPLALSVIYDSRDTLELQVQAPGGARTEAVGLNDAPNVGAHGATLANTGVGPDGVQFLSAGSFRAVISHKAQPLSGGARNEVRVTLNAVDDAPLPHGDWILHLRPSAVNAASNGVVEAWIDELLFRTLTGTSMASPHVAGIAALLFQQDHTRTNADVKRLLISTARPLVITHGGSTQLPNQWDPTAGWGLVDGAAALLGHTGGLLHNRTAAPAAVGKTTGCPVACDDNCLLEAVRSNGSIVSLRPTRDAPYNRAPASPGGAGLASCRRQNGYMAERSGAAFTGGGTFQTVASRRVDRPLVRDREQRGGLEGFEAVTWEDAYEKIVDRFVDQWTETGGVLLIEPRPRLGLVRELLFNLFSHQLHRLLGASTTVTKCSFTIKKTVSVAASRVPFGAPAGGAADYGLREIWNGNAPRLSGRGELSLARHIVLWGANLPGNAADLWTTLQAMHAAGGDARLVFAVDPGLQTLPSFVRRTAILPGSDRDLALALMLRIVGNPGHADAARQIPEHPRFADPSRGLRPLLDPLASTLGDFVTHIRDTAAVLLRLDAGRVVPDAPLLERCLGAGASAADIARFRDDFDTLFEAYLSGPTATILGDGPARQVEGEENVQYIAALSFISGNMGIAGGGVAYAEDREATFNPASFSGSHNTMRPETDRELGSEEEREAINLATLGPDTPSNSRIGLWFDLDPLTALPDASAVEGVLRRLQLNIQATGRLDDSSRFADIILPLGDSLASYDLQLGARSPWINLTQPLETPAAEGPRPLARILHELLAALHEKLKDDFEDDLQPAINENLMNRGPLLLSPTRRRELAQFFTDANRIPNLLRDRLPGDEVANIHTQLKNWYASVHGGEPTTDTDTEVAFGDPVKFFNRMQVDWILEVLLDRYTEREAVMVLYSLLQRGNALDSLRFESDGFGTHPDGDTAFAENIARGSPVADLKGAAGFAPERAAYRDAVRAVDAGATGRSAYPMRLVIAESPEFSSSSIPLSAQVEGGRVKLPIVVLNPASPSLDGRFGGPLTDGAEVAVVGNVSYAAGQRFETVIGKVQVRTDATMARETLWMNPGWHGLDRGGQRIVRGIHTEEGESPATFDNLVRLEPANYAPTANAPDRGTAPAKR